MPTAAMHPNAKTIIDAYAAFGRGDFQYLRDAYFAPGVRWHFPGRNPLAGDYEGIDAVFAFFGRSAQLTHGTLRLSIDDVLADDRRVVAFVAVHAEREGRVLDDRSLQVFEFQDGKVSEVWTYPGDVYGQDAFYA